MVNVIYCDDCKSLFLLTSNLLEKTKRYGLMCFSCLSKNVKLCERKLEIFSVKGNVWQYKNWMDAKKNQKKGALPSIGRQIVPKRSSLAYASDLENGFAFKFIIFTFVIDKSNS